MYINYMYRIFIVKKIKNEIYFCTISVQETHIDDYTFNSLRLKYTGIMKTRLDIKRNFPTL